MAQDVVSSCVAKALRDVKPARLVSEEIEVAGTRVATRQITSTTKRVRRRKSSSGDLPESHTVRDPDTAALDRVHENAPRGARPCRFLDGALSIWYGGSRQNDLQDEDLPQAPRTIAANIDDPPLVVRAAVERRSE